MSTNIKVLMVDDEERFRTTTAKILARKGFETILAESGEQALTMLSENPDVVVLDVRMAGMDGHETLTRIKAAKADLEVIMLTGHGDLPSAQQALKSGAFDYLAKPCDIDLLAAKIEDAVAHGGKHVYKEKTAAEVMIPIEDYTVIDENSTIKDAILALQEAKKRLLATDRLIDSVHRSVLVRRRDGSLAGILSPRNLIGAVRPEYLSAPKPSTADSLQYSAMFWQGLFTSRTREVVAQPVSSFMSDNPPSVDAKANLMDVADTLVTNGVRRLIVTENGKDVGVVREQELFFEISRIVSAS
ncbi:CBS domain-containing protein [Pseudodesulfovibrio tunisiensis]|uniref:CBS domain-containing protein n=1 Tax=Pseudodesulfovibrio tunisiensis TaxID=463192 RepID=UPI001FB1BDB4|nr:response regulator [Pseudodesulfovibrio tunisiensis]